MLIHGFHTSNVAAVTLTTNSIKDVQNLVVKAMGMRTRLHEHLAAKRSVLDGFQHII